MTSSAGAEPLICRSPGRDMRCTGNDSHGKQQAILPMSCLIREETMNHQWRIRRQMRPISDGQQRWDRAYQLLLQWTIATPIEPECPRPPPFTPQEVTYDTSCRDLCPGL